MAAAIPTETLTVMERRTATRMVLRVAEEEDTEVVHMVAPVIRCQILELV
jgi:hypothetical protein